MKGYTLLEVLIGIAITGIILAGAALAVTQSVLISRFALQTADSIRGVIGEIKRGMQQDAPVARLQSGSSMFDFAVVSLEGDTVFGGNSEIIGNVYSKGNIILSGNAKISGNVFATGSINKSGSASITGEENANLSQPLNFRTVDYSGYIAEAKAGGSSGAINLSGNGTAFLGPVNIKGDLAVSGNRIVQLQGPVYIEGNVLMSGNSRIEGPGVLITVGNIQATGNHKLAPDKIPLLISVNGGIAVSGNGITSVFLYAPLGNVSLTGNSKVFGSAVGRSVNGSGNNQIEHSRY